ncbi:cupin domain-containing protein [Streptomyces sp. NPDC003247]|uniref:cupin domain-containing protein n=1 Tax=Streptomyces sp. NPDC003247 TaxID=3364677 RepID=UPI0036C0AF9E
MFLVGHTHTTLLTSAQTGGELSLVESVLPADAGPPPHTHHRESETFIVIEGEPVITAGDKEHEVRAGGVVYVSKGVRHSCRNLSRTTPPGSTSCTRPAAWTACSPGSAPPVCCAAGSVRRPLSPARPSSHRSPCPVRARHRSVLPGASCREP